MKWILKKRVPKKPYKYTSRSFAIFPRTLYYAGEKYFVWLEWYQVVYYKHGNNIESEYPIFKK